MPPPSRKSPRELLDGEREPVTEFERKVFAAVEEFMRIQAEQSDRLEQIAAQLAANTEKLLQATSAVANIGSTMHDEVEVLRYEIGVLAGAVERATADAISTRDLAQRTCDMVTNFMRPLQDERPSRPDAGDTDRVPKP